MQHPIASTNAAEPSSNVISLGVFSIDSASLAILVKLGSSKENALLVILILIERGSSL
ncbi:hypothetical protein [Candidatus Tisiphia endosymbiont of Sialis lutaria]|uniref:hypothetical protein n=1 Tax=Candidatus Tisiphia endosymbiont of Sialis lutaria TaxID=2029164 RepID=UPI00312C773E